MVGKLRRAHPHERKAVNALILRSKAHWGYSADFMEACRTELTLTPDQVVSGDLRVAADGDQLLGVAMVSMDAGQGELSKLFIAPEAMGRGLGRALFGWAVLAATERGWASLTITADPEAAAFYQRMGAVLVGAVPSGSIPGRELPLLRFQL